MKKSVPVLLLILLIISLSGCNNVEFSVSDKERVEFVKKTLLNYGMEVVTEVTPDTLEENNKSTDELVSFGKHQLYELSCGMKSDEAAYTIFYHKFDNTRDGTEEAGELYDILKDSINLLPKSTVTEMIDSKTGNKCFTSHSKTSDSILGMSSDTSDQPDTVSETEAGNELTIVLLYDIGKHEVVELTTGTNSPSEIIDSLLTKGLQDLGWNY